MICDAEYNYIYIITQNAHNLKMRPIVLWRYVNVTLTLLHKITQVVSSANSIN